MICTVGAASWIGLKKRIITSFNRKPLTLTQIQTDTTIRKWAPPRSFTDVADVADAGACELQDIQVNRELLLSFFSSLLTGNSSNMFYQKSHTASFAIYTIQTQQWCSTFKRCLDGNMQVSIWVFVHRLNTNIHTHFGDVCVTNTYLNGKHRAETQYNSWPTHLVDLTVGSIANHLHQLKDSCWVLQ